MQLAQPYIVCGATHAKTLEYRTPNKEFRTAEVKTLQHSTFLVRNSAVRIDRWTLPTSSYQYFVDG